MEDKNRRGTYAEDGIDYESVTKELCGMELTGYDKENIEKFHEWDGTIGQRCRERHNG